MKFNTDVLHAEQVHARLWGSHKPAAMAHVSPIYQTSTYVLEDFDTAVYLNQHVDEGFSYTRFGSPNCDELEKKIAHLEHAEAALALASGLGNVDSLIQHSPSMSHFDMAPEERYASEIFDGQVRLSIGIEDADDLIADLDQALSLI